MIVRRTFIKRASMVAVSSAAANTFVGASQAQQSPNSSGNEPPKLRAPSGACDCHQHIYDAARFPPTEPGEVPVARVEDYRLFQRRIGTSRNVVVTPDAYGTDNSATLDAIARFGGNARGVAVVRPTITDAELKKLADGGIRGIRFVIKGSANAVTSLGMMEPLLKRVNALGLHVQIGTSAEQIVAAKDLWNRLPPVIVFEHLGHIPPAGVSHPAFDVIRRLLENGRTWVKLSAYYRVGEGNSRGLAGIGVIQGYLKAAPERVVWGSNWPHPAETKKPDDAVLFDLLSQWAPDEATRNRILVQNPAALYGFTKPA